MTLKNLCKYYAQCVAKENNTTIKASLDDKETLMELSYIETGAIKEKDVLAFLFGQYEKGKDLVLGYPILKVKDKIVPLFVSRIYHTDSQRNKRGFSIEEEMVFNKEIINKYSINEPDENLEELHDLEGELGFSNGIIKSDNLLGLLTYLRILRPKWDWVDDLNPKNLADGSLTISNEDGILNRAFVIALEPRPYTVGLTKELEQLEELHEFQIADSILGKIMKGTPLKTSCTTEPVVEMLPVNKEQKHAIQVAMNSDLTVIAGPPGTGKTQVVANLIINAILQKKSVLFTSKNNNAVQVVVDRVNSIYPKLPAIIRFTQDTKECLTNYSQLWEKHTPKYDEGLPYYSKYQELAEKYEALQARKQDVLAARNAMDEAESHLIDYRTEYARFFDILLMSDVEDLENSYQHFLSTDAAYAHCRQTFWFKIFGTWWSRRIEKKYNKAIQQLNDLLSQHKIPTQVHVSMTQRERLDFQRIYDRHLEAMKAIASYNDLLHQVRDMEALEQIDSALLEMHVTLQKQATNVWKYWLDQHARAYDTELRTILHRYISSLDYEKHNDFPVVLNALIPASAITSLSARKRIPFCPALYDLLIIDEASQCDIASMIPMMMRAKRAVIIGDKQQLSHICLLNKATDMAMIENYSIDDLRWAYRPNSVYDLAAGVVPSSCIVQLRDHHRSYQDIIAFSNREFYGGQLRIATDYRRLKSPNNGNDIMGLQWMNVVGKTIRPHTGGAYNVEEVEGIIRMLRRLALDLHFEGSIGVTTPFHIQTEMIQRALEADDELLNYLTLHNDILVDTVHKFQGDEKDVIIFSPVVSKGAPSQSLGFLKSTGNIFNVAITRARSLLVTVGNKEYCKHCGVSYLEHFAEFDTGGNAPVASSEWEEILQKALSDAGIQVIAQHHVDKYYLDLAVFKNKRKLDIEVDGAMYHKTWDDELCYSDQLRNQTLMNQGWDVMRFWVQQVRDELPWCVHQIQAWVDNAK